MEELYKNRLYGLEKLRFRVNPDELVWVYLNSFKNDNVLTGKYIYNYGVMTSEMQQGIGMTFDYGSYTQEIVSMSFAELEKMHNRQIIEEQRLEKEYPGIIVNKPQYRKEKIIKQKYDYGWLDTEGNFYKVKWGKHQEWAYKWIIDNMDGMKIRSKMNPLTDEAGDYLMHMGWVLVHNPNPKAVTPLIQRDETKRFTKRQREFLFDYFYNIGMKSKAKEMLDD